MSTRSAIGFIDQSNPSEDIPVAYHHFDGYPSGLGATLFDLARGHFRMNLEAMRKYLVEDHPTGWSSIHDADFTQPAGFEENGFKTGGPHCYCHGGRSEEPWNLTLSKASGSGCEYAYVINPDTRIMYVLSSYSDNGSKMIGMFGMGDEGATWKQIGLVNLDDDEPDWEKMEQEN